MNLPQSLERAIAESRAKVRVGYPWWLRPWLMRDVIGITLGRRIYLGLHAAPASIERLLRHELAHVRQINRLGLLRFYWLYVVEFIRHFRSVRSIAQAYVMISFERDATEAEQKEDPSSDAVL
jgi:hypothetical protein